MRLLMFGPQGAGKGTQATLLAPYWGIPHISTGDIFRANIDAGTPMGMRVAATLRSGELVPDSFTQAMLADRLRAPDAQQGFILDGFPRTPEQATWLDAMLVGQPALDAVIVLSAPRKVLVDRALQRGRADDTVELINRRLDVYFERTHPLIEYYGPRVITVEGNRPVAAVHQEIVARVTEK